MFEWNEKNIGLFKEKALKHIAGKIFMSRYIAKTIISAIFYDSNKDTTDDVHNIGTIVFFLKRAHFLERKQKELALNRILENEERNVKKEAVERLYPILDKGLIITAYKEYLEKIKGMEDTAIYTKIAYEKAQGLEDGIPSDFKKTANDQSINFDNEEATLFSDKKIITERLDRIRGKIAEIAETKCLGYYTKIKDDGQIDETSSNDNKTKIKSLGLHNTAGICFMNVVFYSLFNLPIFREKIEKLKDTNEDKIIAGLNDLFNNMEGKGLNEYNCNIWTNLNGEEFLCAMHDDEFLLAIYNENVKFMQVQNNNFHGGNNGLFQKELLDYISEVIPKKGSDNFIKTMFTIPLKRSYNFQQKSLDDNNNKALKGPDVIQKLSSKDTFMFYKAGQYCTCTWPYSNGNNPMLDTNGLAELYNDQVSKLPPVILVQLVGEYDAERWNIGKTLTLNNPDHKIDNSHAKITYKLTQIITRSPFHVYLNARDPDNEDRWIEHNSFISNQTNEFSKLFTPENKAYPFILVYENEQKIKDKDDETGR
eukprot:GHVP01057904.1.p1 GENE.GHVP01057904.1~~GHVP01057904.1.p1  ORF type:complete len:537 (+),score=86.15 GHVP01057904.1:801-2411(+)